MRVPLESLPDHARIWIFQADRTLKPDQVERARSALADFTEGWTAHGAPVVASSDVRENLFLLLFADEKASGVSGCSIDDSVRTVRALGDALGVDFFGRLDLAVVAADGPRIVKGSDLARTAAGGVLDADTTVFDNTVETKGEWEASWRRPLRNSWAASRLPLPRPQGAEASSGRR